MVIFALIMTALFACLTALTAQRRIGALSPHALPFDEPFFRGLYCIVAVHVPILGYFYYGHTSWAMAYLIDPLRLPLAFGIVLVSFSFISYFFFYIATHALLRAHRPLTAMLASGHVGLAVLSFSTVFRNELAHAGTYFEFHTGTAKLLRDTPLFWQALVGAGLFTLSGLIVFVWNLREAKQYPPLEFEDSRW